MFVLRRCMFFHIMAAEAAADRCLLKNMGFRRNGLCMCVLVGDRLRSGFPRLESVYAESSLLEPRPCLN